MVESDVIQRNIITSTNTWITYSQVHVTLLERPFYDVGSSESSTLGQVAKCPVSYDQDMLNSNWDSISRTLLLTNLVQYVDSLPVLKPDPFGLCPPTPACSVPGGFSPTCTGTFANCSVYLPWSPSEFSVCMSVGNGPWRNCVRGCLQRCHCAHPWWCRWGAAVFALCHADFF